MKIRTAQKKDYSSIVSLWKKSELPFKPLGRDSQKNFEKQLNTPNLKYFLAFENNEIIGSIIVSHNGRKGWINRLAVVPEYRNRGIAGELIKIAENYLRQEGIRIYACLIENWNQASMNLFSKLGYVKHTDIFYFTKREDADV